MVSTVPLADVADNPIASTPNQVSIGCRISAIYLRVEVLATAGFVTVPRIYMAVQKSPGDSIATVPPNSVGTNDNRKWIIHQEMIMVAGTTDVQIPRTMFQGVIKIPFKMQRFGVDDSLKVSFQHDAGETTGITNVCVQCIYKEFR